MGFKRSSYIKSMFLLPGRIRTVSLSLDGLQREGNEKFLNLLNLEKEKCIVINWKAGCSVSVKRK